MILYLFQKGKHFKEDSNYNYYFIIISRQDRLIITGPAIIPCVMVYFSAPTFSVLSCTVP